MILCWRLESCSAIAALLSTGRMAIVPTAKPAARMPSRQVNSERTFPLSACADATRTTGESSGAMRAAASASLLESDFTRPVQIGEKHPLGLLAEAGVLDHGVELVVDRDAERIEIGRADAHPAPVDDARLGVHHLAAPLPDAHAVGKQPAVVAAREQRHPRVIVAARHEDAHIDAVSGRTVQRLDFGPGRREVRRGDPDRPPRRDRLDLKRARDAELERLAFDDADERRLVSRRIEVRAARRPAQKAVRPAPLLLVHPPPHVIECLRHVARRLAFDLHGGVAPPRAMLLENAGRPLAADADAARDTDNAVDDEQLAVIPRHRAEPAPKAGRIEDRDLNAGALERPDELARRAAYPDPVEEKANFHAARRRPGERAGESMADLVRAEDVALERDAGGRVVDELEHGIEGRRPVAQEMHPIAARDVGGGDAPQSASERRPRGSQVEAAAVEYESAGWGRHREGGLQDVCRGARAQGAVSRAPGPNGARWQSSVSRCALRVTDGPRRVDGIDACAPLERRRTRRSPSVTRDG